MYLIQDLNPSGDHWRVCKNNVIVFTGGFKSVLRYAVGELGFNIADFEKAVHALTKLDHNTLEFDSAKCLRSTSYQSISKARKAG